MHSRVRGRVPLVLGAILTGIGWLIQQGNLGAKHALCTSNIGVLGQAFSTSAQQACSSVGLAWTITSAMIVIGSIMILVSLATMWVSASRRGGNG